jgi:hypothetical protein
MHMLWRHVLHAKYSELNEHHTLYTFQNYEENLNYKQFQHAFSVIKLHQLFQI